MPQIASCRYSQIFSERYKKASKRGIKMDGLKGNGQKKAKANTPELRAVVKAAGIAGIFLRRPIKLPTPAAAVPVWEVLELHDREDKRAADLPLGSV